jgi:hypothetical protein
MTKFQSNDMKSIVNHIFFEMLYEYSNLFKGADDELNQIRNIYFIVNQIMIFFIYSIAFTRLRSL